MIIFSLKILWHFLNSSFFVALVTLAAGTIAFYLYDKQKRDSKKDAANIILLEIQSAERMLSQVADDIGAERLPNKYLLPTESWSKYKYYFVRDLDRDEWDRITEFYNNAKLFDEAVRYNSSMFQKNEEQIRVNMLRTPAEYVKEYIDDVALEDVGEEVQRLERVFEKSQKFQEVFLSRIGTLFYNPKKPLADGTEAFNNINKMLSQTSVGTKLKRQAGLKI